MVDVDDHSLEWPITLVLCLALSSDFLAKMSCYTQFEIPKTSCTGCVQLLEILEIYWNLKTLLEILEISLN